MSRSCDYFSNAFSNWQNCSFKWEEALIIFCLTSSPIIKLPLQLRYFALENGCVDDDNFPHEVFGC